MYHYHACKFTFKYDTPPLYPRLYQCGQQVDITGPVTDYFSHTACLIMGEESLHHPCIFTEGDNLTKRGHVNDTAECCRIPAPVACQTRSVLACMVNVLCFYGILHS